MSDLDVQRQFLSASSFAVAGASRDREKYGNRIFRALVASGRTTIPVNPNAIEVEGVRAVATLSKADPLPQALSIVTPPDVTRQIIESALELGIQHIWVQPGAEEATSSAAARQAGINIIDDGSCILVALSLLDRKR